MFSISLTLSTNLFCKLINPRRNTSIPSVSAGLAQAAKYVSSPLTGLLTKVKQAPTMAYLDSQRLSRQLQTVIDCCSQSFSQTVSQSVIQL